MFTGLIQKLGHVEQVAPKADGSRIRIKAEDFLHDVNEGDSIAVNGVCSTALSVTQTHFDVDYLEETLKKTSVGSLNAGAPVNLELAVAPFTRLGGHYVSGHVDCTGEILTLEESDPWGLLTVKFPKNFAPLIIEKGSICVDGISLTLVDIGLDTFNCHLIPHTIHHTNLQHKKAGDKVNLEFDMIGKYLYRFSEVKGVSHDTRKQL